MKNLVCLFLFFFSIHFVAQEEKNLLDLNVHYYGDPLYVINPYSIKENNLLCTDSVLVNDVRVEIVNASAYIIDFEKLNINFGDSINLKIYHKNGCEPRFLVDYSYKINLVEINLVEIGTSGEIEWKVSSQLFKSYKVLQYKWNRWVIIKEGGKVKNQVSYSAKVNPLFGSNRFKIVLLAKDGRFIESKILIYSENIDLEIKKVEVMSNCRGSNYLYFTDSTYYEVYDQYSNLVMKGYSNQIDYRKLKKGIYYFNYDNVTGEIFNKK